MQLQFTDIATDIASAISLLLTSIQQLQHIATDISRMQFHTIAISHCY